jgi:hypothetical protein
MAGILHKVLDVQIARAKRFGFIPFTFDADHKGRKPQKSGQSDRLAHHAAELAIRTTEAAPAVSAKLGTLAKALLGEERLKQAQANVRLYLATRDSGALQGAYDTTRKPAPALRDLSDADRPGPHARAILALLFWHRLSRDPAYLKAAEQQARLACVRFMHDACPLPKAYETPRQTPEGKRFPDFYFRGASLMHAFARLGEELHKQTTD